MSLKENSALSIEDQLSYIMGYTNKPKKAKADGIFADLFDKEDEITYLRDAIKKAVLASGIIGPHRVHIMSLLDEVETLPFEKSAELWETIVVLLNYIKENT